MLYYFLQVILIQSVFLWFYYWFLRNETFFQWNRFYLLGSGVLSFVVPLIRPGWISQNHDWTERLEPVIIGSNQLQTTISQQVEAGYAAQLWGVYIAGVLLFLLIFLYKLHKIFSLVKTHQTIHKSGYTMVLLHGQKEVFSFMHYIFIDEELFRNNNLPILSHELVHIKERHWADLLFFELLKIVFWFNPLLWIYQKEMQLVHEFIADKKVLRNQHLADYFNQILQETFQVRKVSFVNQFFQPKLLKKRIMMQKRKPSKHWKKIKYAAFGLILAGLVSLADACKNEPVNDNDNVITKEQLEKIPGSDIEQITVTKNPDKVTIITKSGEEKVYYPKKDDIEIQKFDTRINSADEDTREVYFNHLKNAPVYPGCEGLKGDESKKCFSKKIQEFVSRNFRTELADSLKLNGERVKILTMFTIDTQGKVSKIRARSKYKPLEKEAKRVLSMLPQVKPGMQDGKKVKVTYTLPIIFKVE